MTTPPWPERLCERCRVRAVGVTGSDPHLCDECAKPAHERDSFDLRDYRQSLMDQAWDRRRDRS